MQCANLLRGKGAEAGYIPTLYKSPDDILPYLLTLLKNFHVFQSTTKFSTVLIIKNTQLIKKYYLITRIGIMNIHYDNNGIINMPYLSWILVLLTVFIDIVPYSIDNNLYHYKLSVISWLPNYNTSSFVKRYYCYKLLQNEAGFNCTNLFCYD